jgi:hypothetical protein
MSGPADLAPAEAQAQPIPTCAPTALRPRYFLPTL